MRTTTVLGILLLAVGLVAFFSLGAFKPQSKTVPGINFGAKPDYDVKAVQDVIKTKADTSERTMAQVYVWPVLWPVDLIVLIGLGIGMALVSMALAPYTSEEVNKYAWLLALIPLGYALGDLAENISLTMLLSGSDTAVTPERINAVQAVTWVKLVLFVLAAVQTLGLSLWAGVRWLTGH